jgi:hypothetical protein
MRKLVFCIKTWLTSLDIFNYSDCSPGTQLSCFFPLLGANPVTWRPLIRPNHSFATGIPSSSFSTFSDRVDRPWNGKRILLVAERATSLGQTATQTITCWAISLSFSLCSHLSQYFAGFTSMGALQTKIFVQPSNSCSTRGHYPCRV